MMRVFRVLAVGVVLCAGAAFAGDDDDAKMTFNVPHHWSRADAHARTQMLFDYWKKAYGVTSTWTGDRAHVVGKVMGISIDAVLEVADDHIGGEGKDPGFLTRGMARTYITKKLQKYMHPKYEEP